MKTYVINLASQIKKKEHIISECKKLNLDFEIYNAVNGAELSEEFINKNVLDYPNCYLTKGEIGCALSHINIYKEIVRNNLPYALILEDDAVLDPSLVDFIKDFENYNKKQGIFLLIGYFKYIKNKKTVIGRFPIYPIESAFYATGYIITLDAAKKMINFLFPIRYEADVFKIFSMCAGVKIYATVPHLVSSNDKDKSNSTLEQDRKKVKLQRKLYRSKVFKHYEKRNKVKRFFWRIFIKPTLQKEEYIE